jgi:peptidoglycan-N-acetylglucosamine deacetylase
MKPLIITTSWDDGSYQDEQISNLLKKYGIKGTFYIPKNFLPNSLSPDLICNLDTYHEIGAHTMNHVELPNIPTERAFNEIHDSKLYLEDLLGHDISMFAYPKGLYNSKVKQLVQKSGFLGARTVDYVGLKNISDPYSMGVSLLMQNGSPIFSLKSAIQYNLDIKSVIDWEIRVKELFDYSYRSGGVLHLFSHSWMIDRYNQWEKLESVFNYISGYDDVLYLTNGELMDVIINE